MSPSAWEPVLTTLGKQRHYHSEPVSTVDMKTEKTEKTQDMSAPDPSDGIMMEGWE